MRVLVTGGAGYIGSVTVRALLGRGWEVEVLDDLSTGHEQTLPPGVPLHRGRLDDPACLDRAFARPHDAVVHFAARSLVSESAAAPLAYYRDNVGGTVALLERLAAGGARRCVFSSSAAVYGQPELTPIPEEAPLAPINPYGRTKVAMEWALADAARAHGIAAVALRYFNAAGADGGLGEDHEPETHLIPRLLRSLLEPGRQFQIFGDDYHTPDGTCVRDYIHVADLAEAHALAIAWADRPGFQAINLGSARGFSVREIVAAAAAVTGRALAPAVAPRRPGDPVRLVASCERARALLGWRPERSDLSAIIADAWAWHCAHPRGYRG